MVSEGKRLHRRKKRKGEKKKKKKPSFFSDNPASNLSKCINIGTRCQIGGSSREEEKKVRE